MRERDALTQQAPSLALQRAAADEIARLGARLRQAENVLRLVLPVVERQRYEADCSYGKNFVETRAASARERHDAVKSFLEARHERT